MFDRKKYKKFAKMQLKGRWAVPVYMTIIITLILLIFDIPDFIRAFNDDNIRIIFSPTASYTEIFQAYNEMTERSGSLLSTFIQTIVEAILIFASINVYMKMSRSPEKVSLRVFFEGMNNWGKAILAVLWKSIWIALWTMLFIIPGIIKSIAYSQMYYILCEYPDVSVTKAMRLSMIITRGHKGDLFITYLSFFGWILLAALTLGIGTFWLEPYMEMTLMNAYHALIKEALETGKIKPEDLTE